MIAASKANTSEFNLLQISALRGHEINDLLKKNKTPN